MTEEAEAKEKHSVLVFAQKQQIINWLITKGSSGFTEKYTLDGLAEVITQELGIRCTASNARGILLDMSVQLGVPVRTKYWRRAKPAKPKPAKVDNFEKQLELTLEAESPIVAALDALRHAMEAMTASQLALLRQLCNSRGAPAPPEEDGVVPSSQPAYQS